MTIIQITPAFPPAISGVGDYAEILHRSLCTKSPVSSTLVSRPITGLRHANVVCLSGTMSSKELATSLSTADHVLLHFSGYGYARWGLCRWLVKGLKDWKAGHPNRRLVTLFHEVAATGPVWRSSFWTAEPQRRIARELASLSDAGFVTSEGGRQQLQKIYPTLPVNLLPVVSNIGEPDQVSSLDQRTSIAVVFGGVGRRKRAYDSAAKQVDDLERGFSRLGINEVVDIGPGNVAPPVLAGCPVHSLGTLAAKEVSEWLSKSRIGLIYYPGHVMTKSGVVAAYFAHGLLVVNTGNLEGLPSDLISGRDFLTPQHLIQEHLDLQSVATSGRSWYLPHGVDASVSRIMECIAVEQNST